MRKTKFARLAALALTLVLAIGSLSTAAFAAENAPAAEPASFEVNSFEVNFAEDGSGEELAAPVALAKGGWAALPEAVYPEKQPAGKKLAGWKLGSKVFAPGQAVLFDQLDMMVLTGELACDADAEGHLTVTAYAVFEDAEPDPEPTPAEKAAYQVIFRAQTDDSQGELAAPVAMEKEGWAALPEAVYPEKQPAGKKLTGWKLGSRVFAPGEKVEAIRLSVMWAAGEIKGDQDADGLVTFTAYAVFEDTEPGPGPVELSCIELTFVEDKAGAPAQVAAAIRVEKGGWALLPEAVAPEHEPTGKKLAGWKLGGSGKAYAPGQKVTFEELAALVGENGTPEGTGTLAFCPVYKNAEPGPAAPVEPEQPGETLPDPEVKPDAPVVSTGKALPKTGARSAAPTAAGILLLAGIAGAGVSAYLLRRKEG